MDGARYTIREPSAETGYGYFSRCHNCIPNSVANPQTLSVLPNIESYTTVHFMVKVVGKANGVQRVTLQADNGLYMTTCVNCLGPNVINQFQSYLSSYTGATPQQWDAVVVPQCGCKVRLLNIQTDRYLTRCRNCATGGPTDIGSNHVTSFGTSCEDSTVLTVAPTRIL